MKYITVTIHSDNDNPPELQFSRTKIWSVIGIMTVVIAAVLAAYTYTVKEQLTIVQVKQQNELLQAGIKNQQMQIENLYTRVARMDKIMRSVEHEEIQIRKAIQASIPILPTPPTDVRQSDSDEDTENNSGANKGGIGGPGNEDIDIQLLERVVPQVEQAMSVRLSSISALRVEAEKESQYSIEHNPLLQKVTGGTVPNIWPVKGNISSYYGYRWGEFHTGVDIAADYGEPIVAAADGLITNVSYNTTGYGNMLDIDHGGGVVTRYAHASAILVSEGTPVNQGQMIALVGSTGRSTGPHLHYEVRVNGQPVNPLPYLLGRP